jgi:hypothetical protein
MMNQRSAKLTLWALALCLLLATAVLPALAKAQATSSVTSSDAIKKPKKKSKAKPSTGDQSAESGSAVPAPITAANSTNAAPDTSASPAVPRKTKVASGNSSPEIAAAKSSGKVWVNLDSGIYHKGGRWYGKTKTGKFMTEAEAKAAGYKESKRD